MVRVLGIDPGSISTGLGIVDIEGEETRHVYHRALKVSSKLDFPSRIKYFHDEVTRVLDEFSPTVSALEKVFVSLNPNSALKLGLVRGAIMLSCTLKKNQIIEISPREMKLSLTGHGGADKTQVASMVRKYLGITEKLTSDESDALALALTAGFLMKSRIFQHSVNRHGRI